MGPDTIWVLIPLAALAIPIIKIWSSHRQKIAEIEIQATAERAAQNATRNFRAVAFVNTHLDAAHLEVLKQVVEESKKAGVSACFVDLTRKRWAQQLGEAFQKGDHAGAFETSAMMALNLPLGREQTR